MGIHWNVARVSAAIIAALALSATLAYLIAQQLFYVGDEGRHVHPGADMALSIQHFVVLPDGVLVQEVTND